LVSSAGRHTAWNHLSSQPITEGTQQVIWQQSPTKMSDTSAGVGDCESKKMHAAMSKATEVELSLHAVDAYGNGKPLQQHC